MCPHLTHSPGTVVNWNIGLNQGLLSLKKKKKKRLKKLKKSTHVINSKYFYKLICLDKS